MTDTVIQVALWYY